MNKLVVPLAVAVALTLTTGGVAQQLPERRREGVLPGSPVVNLQDVGKRVAPGVFEVNPEALKGRRLVISRQDRETGQAQAKEIHICLGKWKGGRCEGVLIIIEY